MSQAKESAAGLPADFLERLRASFGERAQAGHAVREQHGTSESHIESVLPDLVVFARSTEDVVTVVRLCSEFGVPLTPFGAGTSLEGQAVPIFGGVSLDLSMMNEIIEVNADDLDCTVQCGVRREQLNLHLRDAGLFFPIDPGANATIGGMTATRASGTNAVRYGTIREAVLSLKVVTAMGEVIRTGQRARKSAAGYDLTHLMVGSEGTLGIITEITLRLHGIPDTIIAAVCGFETLAGAVSTVVQTIQMGVPIARVEFLDDVQMRAVNLWAGLDYPELTTLFFEFHGSQQSVAEQVATVEALAQANGGGAFQWSSRPEERNVLWKARHEAYYAGLALRKGSVGWPTDVCVPISTLPECIAATKQDLLTTQIPAPIVGHVGDGNFHVLFVLDPDSPEEAAEASRLNDRLIERAIALGGTCTGEHGIGTAKQHWLEIELGAGTIDIMRRVKRALDPQNIINPGKVFSLSPRSQS